MGDLELLIPKLKDDTSVRAVLITAEGNKNFSAGMNLMQLAAHIYQAK